MAASASSGQPAAAAAATAGAAATAESPFSVAVAEVAAAAAAPGTVATAGLAAGYDAKIEAIQKQLSSTRERCNNLQRAEPRLDWARKRRVAKGMDFSEAVDEAINEAEQKIIDLRADLSKLQADKQQALSVEDIKQKTNLIPAVKMNTDQIPEMLDKVTKTFQAICEGNVQIPTDLNLDEGQRVIRWKKAGLTSTFQHFKDMKKAQPQMSTGEALEGLEAKRQATQGEQDELQRLKDEHVQAKDRKAEIAKEAVSCLLAGCMV